MKPFDGPHAQHFPYLVIRWLACAYDVRRIELGPDPTRLEGGAGRVQVQLATGADTAAMRRAVLDACHQIIHKCGRRCCAVFGPDDTVFCEPGGIEIVRRDSPSGGMQVGPLALEPTPHRRSS